MRVLRWSLLLSLVVGAAIVEAQVGSRGAVEVRREHDDIPPAPGEEADEDAAREVAPDEQPADPPQPRTRPEVAQPEETRSAIADAPPRARPAARSPSDRPSTPDDTTTSEPEESDSTTVVLEREADPILDEVKELVSLFGSGRTTGGLLALLIWFALAAVITGGIRRIRARFPAEGLLPNLLALVHLGMRLVMIALALAFIVRALPPRLSLVMLLAFAGLAVAIGWSLRDVMPDLVASLVIAFERRIRRGVWVSGRGFAGHVERLGLRAALLYDTHGNRVMVPNREIVRAPVTAGVGEHARELEVEVRISGPADQVRAALRDAVLTSPWVHPDARPVVLRDPADPTRWRVRGRLLEASFGARFEGELLERAEALLRKES